MAAKMLRAASRVRGRFLSYLLKVGVSNVKDQLQFQFSSDDFTHMMS